MLYSLFDYYAKSGLGYSGIISHYINHFYMKRNDLEKVRKISTKVKESTKFEYLYRASVVHHAIPSHTDFMTIIDDIFWFSFRSKSTQAVGVMEAMEQWVERSMFLYHQNYLKIEAGLRYNVLMLIKKLDLHEEMTEEEYKNGPK